MMITPSLYQKLAGISEENLATGTKTLKWRYGNASCPAYCYQAHRKQHPPKEICTRKIVAIPMALYSGVIKTTYHLSRAIFQGIPKAFSGNTLLLKMQIYHLIRDLEESLGWLITLFHDKLGSYFVEESIFQKECYSNFEINSEQTVIPSENILLSRLNFESPIT